MESLYAALKHALNQDELIAQVTVVAGQSIGSRLLLWPDGRSLGDLGDPVINQAARQAVAAHFERLASGRLLVDTASETVDLFIEVFPPLPRLIIIGAVHIADALVRMAKIVGFHTVVIDPRSAFATRDRFPAVDQLLVEWPTDALIHLKIDSNTWIVTLSHDDKLDIPALELAIQSPARYVGALGSTKTHARRVDTLAELGCTPEQIARIHSPVGLEIGAESVAEIAVAILAQLIEVRRSSF